MTLYLYMDVSGCAATCTSAGLGFPLTLGLLRCVNCCVAEFSAERTETSPSTGARRRAALSGGKTAARYATTGVNEPLRPGPDVPTPWSSS